MAYYFGHRANRDFARSPEPAKLKNSLQPSCHDFSATRAAMMRNAARALLLCYAIALAVTTAVAGETAAVNYSAPSMQEIFITGSRPAPLIQQPRSVALISASDIAVSGADNLPALLALEANLALTSFSGNEKFSRIDVRGSGDSATSNVLVLVDGIARNQQDLSGTDYSSISLTQIERIEIIRGPSTVRYGSGASNGVINILTRAQPKGSALELSSRYNSYDNASFAAKTSLAGVDQSIAIKTDFANNTGYRQHNALRTRNTSLYWRLGNNKQRFFSVTARKHDDAYQLPGPLSRADLDSGTIDRRDAEPARSSAGSSDNESYALRLQFFNDDEVTVRGIAYYDDQSRDFVFASSPGNFASLQASPSAERDRIQSYTHGADLLADWQPDRAAIALYAGLAFRHSRYSRTDGGRRRENRLINEGALNSGAAHVFGEWQASHSLRVNAGYRRAITSSTFRSAQLKQNENSPECTRTNVDLGGGNIVTIVDDCPLRDEERERDEQRWHNEALEMGASLQPSSNHAYYINFAKSYRNPNIDELALKPSGEDSLRPQRAGHIEAGYRYAGESISAGLALFHSRTRDEIIFRTDGQLALVNRNFNEAIVRRGTELEVAAKHKRWFARGTLGLIDARTPDDKRIPLVPRFNASLRLGRELGQHLSVNAIANWVGERLDGNDFENNSYRKLDAHATASIRLAFEKETSNGTGWHAFAGINNVFDYEYFSASYSEMVYPANARSIYGGFQVDL